MSVYYLNDPSFGEELKQEDVDYVKINADKGEPEAQYHLGLMFDSGRGVERNAKEAEKWYRKAAEQGHTNAMYYLARMHGIETSGIERNETEALKWYKKAAEQGSAEASRFLATAKN